MARRIDAGGDLTKRPPLAGLNRQNVQALRQVCEHTAKLQFTAVSSERPDHIMGQPRAVLGADRRKVAPDFSKTLGAVGIRDPHEHRRPVVHGSERGPNRHRDWGPNDLGLNPGDAQA